MEFILFPAIFLSVLSVLSIFIPSITLWYKRSRCPKCGGWHCLKYVTEVITDKTVGHDRIRFGSGGLGSRRSYFRGLHTSHTADQPFIRYWIEERYICQKCGRHVSVHTKRDKR